jgi:hypothetical protein
MNQDFEAMQLRLRRGVKLLKKRERERERRRNGLVSRVSKMRANLKAEYGMSLETYYQLRSEQLGRCAICNRYENQINHNSQKLVVDHDHETGKVRGLICHKCNAGLGAFKDSPELLESAKQYLLGNHGKLTDEQVAAVTVRPYKHNNRTPWMIDLRRFGLGRRFFKTCEDATIALQQWPRSNGKAVADATASALAFELLLPLHMHK